MNTTSKMLNNRDGSIDNVIISSNDNYKVNLANKYVLVGYKGNKYVDNFKNSIFGTDIGTNSNGFVSIMLVSILLAIASFIGMYLTFKI